MTQIKKPHKHAEVIHAFADGAEIEFRDGESWELSENPSFYVETEYRIKPNQVMAWYRVAQMEAYSRTANNAIEEGEIMERRGFVRWLTDRIEYPVSE